MYFAFTKLNPVRKVALNAPPVPKSPVMSPETPPPVITVLVLVGNLTAGLNRNKIEITIRNIPRITLRISCDNMPTIEAPTKLSRMLGIPNVIIIFISRPCLKN
jgi:hypothetical protein